MAEELTELVIALRADVAGLKASLESAKSETDKFSDSLKENFSELGTLLAEVFAIEKIKDWVTEGIAEFAKFDQQLELVVDNLERHKQATEDSKEQVEAWSKSLEKLTMFSKEQMVASLNKLITMTGDLAKSQQLVQLAMDVSTRTGMDLESVSRALGNAYEGNYAGLRGLTREFPELKRVMLEGGDIFKVLTENTEGLAAKMGEEKGGLAFQIKQMKEAWKDAAEDIAKHGQTEFTIVIQSIAFYADKVAAVIAFLIKGIVSLPVMWARTVRTIVDTGLAMLEHVGVLGQALDRLVHLDFAGAQNSWKAYQYRVQEAKEETYGFYTSMLNNIWKSTGAVEESSKNVLVSTKTAGVGAKAAIKEVADALVTLTKPVLSFQEALTRELTVEQMTVTQALASYGKAGETLKITLDKNSKTYESDKEAFNRMVHERTETVKKAAKVLANELKKVADQIGFVIAQSFSTMSVDIIKGTFEIGSAFEKLAKNIVRVIVNAFADVMVAEGTGDIKTGLANLLNPSTMWAAPGYFASGAAKIAGGGLVRGMAEVALAEGGVVTKPTIALIGEAGPEKVVPLNRAGADAGGGINIHGPVNLPNVRDPRQFIQELQRMKSRAGYRYTSF